MADQVTVVTQFRVDCPSGYNSWARALIVPDLVLLVTVHPLAAVRSGPIRLNSSNWTFLSRDSRSFSRCQFTRRQHHGIGLIRCLLA